MLRFTPTCLTRSGKYFNRVMHFPHRRQNALYLPPKQAHCKTPLANKGPEDYGETWNQRTGTEWYYKLRNRNQYRHWPWVTWKDDPIRRHSDGVCRRTFSAKNSGTADKPLWNLYQLVGQDYRIGNDAPVTAMTSVIAIRASRAGWGTKSSIQGYLEKIAERWPTIRDLNRNIKAFGDWNRSTNTVPHGLQTHILQLVADIASLNKKKAFRLQQHEQGVLRTNTMQRYYALPYLQQPQHAMPTTLAQPAGVYPKGLFTEMNGGVTIHPVYQVDKRTSKAMYPE